MNIDTAVDIVARHVLFSGVGNMCWEDYPEIGESDWDNVQARAKQIASPPDSCKEAYEMLADRAEMWIDS